MVSPGRDLPSLGPVLTGRTAALLPLPQESDAFVFAIFGDRTGGPAEGVSVLADAVRDVNLLEPASHFKGHIDAVRLSATDRYRGESFQPDRRAAPGDRSLLVLDMDGLVGPWLFDESPQRAHVLTPKPIVLTPASP